MTPTDPSKKCTNTPRTCPFGYRPPPDIFFEEEKASLRSPFLLLPKCFLSFIMGTWWKLYYLRIPPPGGWEKHFGRRRKGELSEPFLLAKTENHENLIFTFFGAPCIICECVASMCTYASQLCRAYCCEDFKWSAISVTWLGQILCAF